MPRNMVIGKLKYLIGPASGMIIHPLLNVGSGWSRHAAAEWLSHPEIFEFQDVIKIKNKITIFSQF